MADGKAYEVLLAALIDLSYGGKSSDPSLSLLVTCRCADAAVVVDEVARLANGAGARVVAHIAAGSVYAHYDEMDAGGSTKRIVDALMERFPRARITLFGTRDTTRDDDVFIIGNECVVSLRRAIKESFDPHGLMNPGMPKW